MLGESAFMPGKEVGLAALVDVETTGLSPSRHEVLEIAVLLFAFRRDSGEIAGLVDEYIGLREPRRRYIPYGATAIHGITYDMVQGRSLDDERILELFGRAEFLVAHNASFDYGFVARMYPEVNQKPWLCSMRQVNWRQYGFPSRGLQPLLAAHGIHPETAHRAAADCRAVLALLNRPSPQGNTYFQELLLGLQAPAVGGRHYAGGS